MKLGKLKKSKLELEKEKLLQKFKPQEKKSSGIMEEESLPHRTLYSSCIAEISQPSEVLSNSGLKKETQTNRGFGGESSIQKTMSV
mgnify:CR=1 FL=1